MITCLLFSYQNLAGLTLQATEPDAQFAGKDCKFILRLIHTKTAPQDVSFTFQYSSSKLQTVIEEECVSLYAFSNKRGYFNPGRVTVRSCFPFGLFTVWTHLDFGFKMLLYPLPIENQAPATCLLDNTLASNNQQSIAGVDQFSTLKNYQQGESLKSVAWKQLAQGRGWLTKQFEQSAGGDLLLDMHSLSHLPLETRLSFLCYQVIELQKQNRRYALSLTSEFIETSVGNTHKHRCLQALALFKSTSAGHQQ